MAIGQNRPRYSLLQVQDGQSRTIDQHLQLRREHDKRLDQNLKDKIQFNEKDSEWKSPFLDMKDELATMWDAHLGRVIAAEHRIDLTEPDKTLINQNPHRAGPPHHEFQKTGAEKMLAGVIDLTNTE